MGKASKNCRSLNMQTIRVRREKPGSVAISIALAITMLIVWLLSLQSCPKEETQAVSAVRGSSSLQLEGMDMQFLLDSVHDDRTQANIAAAQCAQNGGAGIVLEDDGRFAVVYEAGRDFSHADAPVLRRSAAGVTMKIEAPAEIITALSEGTDALYALSSETAALASSLEGGQTDAKTISALLNIYMTQIKSADAALKHENAAIVPVKNALARSLERIQSTVKNPDPGKLRLIHAAGCLEWMGLIKQLRSLI